MSLRRRDYGSPGRLRRTWVAWASGRPACSGAFASRVGAGDFVFRVGRAERTRGPRLSRAAAPFRSGRPCTARFPMSFDLLAALVPSRADAALAPPRARGPMNTLRPATARRRITAEAGTARSSRPRPRLHFAKRSRDRARAAQDIDRGFLSRPGRSTPRHDGACARASCSVDDGSRP